ncbi:hypothetical protein QE152_g7347 [Popillia japonica]|uniref:Uncharacterized protein n=1 Tax=Popillia japonica TaxID=7064 RepID=A0AAW1MB78_POPJA
MASNKIDLEIGGNFVIWIGVVLFAGYQVKLVSDDLCREYDIIELSPGWKILGGKTKDTTDYDWEIMKYIVYQQIHIINTGYLCYLCTGLI